MAGARVFLDESRLLRGEGNPARGADFLDVEETQDGWDIRFVNIRLGLGLGLRRWVFEYVSIRVQYAWFFIIVIFVTITSSS